MPQDPHESQLSEEAAEQPVIVRRDEQGRAVQVIDFLVRHSKLTLYDFDPATALEQLSDDPETASPPAA